MNKLLISLLATVAGAVTLIAATIEKSERPTGNPEATVDLTTADGAALAKGQWRYADTRIVEASFRAPGAANQPTGALANQTEDP